MIIEDFDLEQIWQQLELQNEDLLRISLPEVSKFAVKKDRLLFHELDKDLSPEEKDNEENEEESSSDSENEEGSRKSKSDDELNNGMDDSSDSSEDLEQDEGDLSNKSKSNKRSVVDDDFFKLDEMEQFLKAEEKALDKEPEDDSGNESKEDEEEIDYFKDSGDDEDNEEENEEDLREKNPRYKDFFRPSDTEKPIKRNKFLEEEESNDDNDTNVNEAKSSFELQQERMKNKIKILEDIALSEKPWQLQGEITAENRPQNSLLEEVVEFDLTSRPGNRNLLC